MTKEQINKKAKKARVDIHGFAQELRKNKEELASCSKI